MISIRKLLKETKAILKNEGIEHFSLEAEVIIANALGLESRECLLLFPDDVLSSQIVKATTGNQSLAKASFDTMGVDIEKAVTSATLRRVAGEPLAYIISHKEFWGLSFIVSPAVLIPRPETEMLVEIGGNYIKDGFSTKINSNRLITTSSKPIRILDLGTGSGCIIISLLKELRSSGYSNAVGVGVDISDDALEVACKNAFSHGLLDRIDFIKSDWLQNVQGKFDLVVCNPPYIAKNELITNNYTYRVHEYEPLLALTDNEDGLECYRRIARDLKEHLAEDGIVVFEHGYYQRDVLINLFVEFGYSIMRCYDDLAGLARVIIVKLSIISES